MTFESLWAEIQANAKKTRSHAWLVSDASTLPRVLNEPSIAIFGSLEMVKDQFAKHRVAVDAQKAFIESPAFKTLTHEEQKELLSQAINDACMATMT